MKQQLPELVIFSPCTGDFSDRLDTNYCKQRLTEHDIPYREVVGCYQGFEEISFVVDAIHLPMVEKFARY